MAYQYEVGDIVKLKKKHPCGSFEWEILRVGVDFRLKCQGCGHQIMVPRKMVEKKTNLLNLAYLPELGLANCSKSVPVKFLNRTI